MTTYIVFERIHALEDGEHGAIWLLVGVTEASGPVTAANKAEATQGEYMIVPTRNATFLNRGAVQPPPKVTTTEIDVSHYLNLQLDTTETEPTDEVQDAEMVSA